MLNYGNLSDVEFEYLCQDIMEKKLGIKLRRFAAGPDGGVDIADNTAAPQILVQVKQYINSPPAQLLTSLKKEVPKVKNINPKQYYVCCAKCLSPMAIAEIYEMFSDYMDSDTNIITLNEIEDFLTAPENRRVLEKHYKLWIESTGILQSVFDGDIYVDSDVLIKSAIDDLRLFVRTSAFDEAKKRLESKKKRILFIVGDPGVGKSITSNMLALYFLAKGYRLRATSNTSDFYSLKRSLSRDPNVKEIILVDDCFGQAYFDLRDHQNSDLLSLIRYVYTAKNKLMILNSRVTIFQEAKERKRDLVKAIDNKEYGVYVLDMSRINDYEKARILYNHLYASDIDERRFAEIRKERRYRRIISHPNYNPRIIEYVCTPKHYASVPAEEFYSFIENNLNNPREVWKDEYENRLQIADRILLLTVFSLSDYNSDEGIVKQCFDHWIERVTGIDLTVNQFEASLRRLLDSFLRIVDQNGHRMIGVASPAINDYIKWRIKSNTTERDLIIHNACSIQQYEKMLQPEEFVQFADQVLLSGKTERCLFMNDYQRTAFIAWRIGENEIKDPQYIADIQRYIMDPGSLIVGRSMYIGRDKIMKKLMVSTLIDYYHMESLVDQMDLEEIFSCGDLKEKITLVSLYSPLFEDPYRERFVERAADAVISAIEDQYESIDASDYNPDVECAVRAAICDEEEMAVDEQYAVQLIEADVEHSARDMLEKEIKKLPQDVRMARDYINEVDIDINGADDLVTQYLEEQNTVDDYELEAIPHELDEIDLLFERR